MAYDAPSRRDFIGQVMAGCAAMGTLPGGLGSAAASGQRPPNILLIFADDVGREVLGCYGGTSYETLNIDALARGGMRFTHGYAMPVCHPSRVCLMTGRYPFRVDNPGWGTFPKAEEGKTIAQVLKRAGYATAVAGKWQLTLLKEDPEHPARLGFDESCLFGWHEGARYYAPLLWQNGRIREDVDSRYGPDVYCDFLIDFMDRHQERPFFAYYPMALCHNVTDDLDEPVPFAPGKHRYDSYAEMVGTMDQCVGRLMEALEARGLRENTLVLFVTDNGTPAKSTVGVKDGRLVRRFFASKLGSLTVPGGKGKMTDWGTRVPWIANWPGAIDAGRVVDDMVDLTDLLPTLAEVAKTESPANVPLDGVSFADVLSGDGPGKRDWVYSERKERRSVRDKRYRLYGDGQFFDAEADPFERSPLDVSALDPAAARAHTVLSEALIVATP